jgi:hypothetical protein
MQGNSTDIPLDFDVVFTKTETSYHGTSFSVSVSRSQCSFHSVQFQTSNQYVRTVSGNAGKSMCIATSSD